MEVRIGRRTQLDSWLFGVCFVARTEVVTCTGHAIVGPYGAHVMRVHERSAKRPKATPVRMSDPAIDTIAKAVHDAMAADVQPQIDREDQ